MSEPTQSPSSPPAPAAPSRTLEGTAYVSVGADSRTQVTLLRGPQQVSMKLRGVGEGSFELASPVFFPKHCALEITLSTPGETAIRGLRGVVRKVQMTDVEPEYTLVVQLESDSAKLLAEQDLVWDGAREAQSKSAVVAALAGGPLPRWASLLVGRGLLTDDELRAAAGEAQHKDTALEEILLNAGVASRETIAVCMALDMSVAYVEPRAYDVHLANRALVPEELARRHSVFPLFHIGGVITLGMGDPTDLALIDRVRLTANSQVDPCLCPPGTLGALIEAAYRAELTETDQEAQPEPEPVEAEEPEELQSGNAIVRLVHAMLSDSARSGASDIHIEPEKDHLRIRIRVDGILHETATHPQMQHAPIVSRLKVMAKLDISESRRPQDGHFSLTVDRRTLDVRVSTIPTVHGENVVLRLLLSDDQAIRLELLGMPPNVLERVQHFLSQPNGMVLVTGPTGSGKTTTLYAALERLSTVERNVVTVEDPVEKRVPLLRQTEVNPKAGVTFATGLRSILRQDPDVIMVGEIRDRETAEIAVQAALTGHLVLSTLHTNTAAGAIVRLAEMGVTSFLITSALRAVVSQRLARRVCQSCARPVDPDPRLLAGLGLTNSPSATYMAGAGCVHCLQTGYKGRIGIYEVLEITGRLSQALLGGASREKIEREAEHAIGTSLRDDGLRKVREGLTTVEEIARILGLVELRAIEEGE